MTPRPARALLGAGALLLAVTLAGCGGDSSSASDGPTTPASGSATDSAPSDAPSATTESSPSDEVTNGPSLEVTVDGDSITPTNKGVEVSTGDTLTLVITSNRAGELHVHTSPEQELEFRAGKTQLPITFKQPGQVDIEEHASDTLIARVLVK